MKIIISTQSSGNRTVLTTSEYQALSGDTKLEKGDVLIDTTHRADGFQELTPIGISSIHHPCVGLSAKDLPSSVFAFREITTPAPTPTINAKFSYTAPSFDEFNETYGEYIARKNKEMMETGGLNQIITEPASDDFVSVRPMSFARIKKRLAPATMAEELTFVKLPLKTMVAKNDIIVSKGGIQCTLTEAYNYPHYESNFCGMGYVTCNKPGWGGGSFSVARILDDSGGFAIYRAQTGPFKYTSANKVDPLPLP